jgi:hypothetical protein
MSVDGVHCRIQEARVNPSSKWNDYKSNSAGVSYELAIAVQRSQLV